MKKYSVSVIEKTGLSPTAEGTGNCRSLGFEFENHDDLFHIIEKVHASGLFDDRQETVRFCVGLKLFSSVMMSLLTAMAAAAIAPAMGNFQSSPVIILPLAEAVFGTADITGPYKIAVCISVIFLIQVWATRRLQSLPPAEKGR